MKTLILFSVLFSFLIAGSNAQDFGSYYVYFGDLHNHSNVSDGSGTPEDAYDHAKNAGLDFFGLSDHSDGSGKIEGGEWSMIWTICDYYNRTYTDFVALRGFEWTHDVYGHVNVYNTTDLCKSRVPPIDTFEELVSWLNDRPNSIAFFNHPGLITQWYMDSHEGVPPNPIVEFNKFTSAPSDHFVGIELWNCSNTFNYNDPNTDYIYPGNDISYYDEANIRGWKIGAMGAGDEHWGKWGDHFDSKMAILAENLTENDLITAMQARRFYSTLDGNLLLSFRINNQQMGSRIAVGNHSITIHAKDKDGDDNFKEVIMYDQDHNEAYKKTYSTPYPSSAVCHLARYVYYGEYYYVHVIQADGGEAISSPIWVTECSGPTVFENQTITSNRPITGCDLTIRNVTVQNNADVVIQNWKEVTIEKNFQVKLGSTLTME